VSQRRFEDRIQNLAAKAVAAQDPTELADTLRELREALQEHAAHLRKLVAENHSRSKTKRDRIVAMPNPTSDNVAAD
jgi:uncharacterized coiled-coil protein SlyX